MNYHKMPVIFLGHGSPMLALEHNEITEKIRSVGSDILARYGKPRGILAISAHWYTGENLIQDTEKPEQIYDMFGFPNELYDVKYPATGNSALSAKVRQLLGDKVHVNNSWGIDHGTWTVLVHLFPDADIPVVQLSVNSRLTAGQSYALGQKLAPLRQDGWLILGSGNVVHNLRQVQWNSTTGSTEARAFNDYIVDALEHRKDKQVIHYQDNPNASYAVPTPDHFLPLLYLLGAAEDDTLRIFNNSCNLGAIAMTSFESSPA
jgi:4,5-DOPA dioxygenase extradiol